jgi:dipeptidyl aminopeptidase/acylaminoacyl peptidase
LTNTLVKKGYVVLAYDIRLHGTSGKDGKFADLFNNPNRAPLDLKAALKFLKNDGKINANRIGIIGASIGSNLATVAASDKSYGIKSVVILSAKTSAVQNLSGQKNTISPKNAFYIASKEEQGGKRDFWANELYKLTSGKKKVSIAPGKKHGSYILREHTYLQDEILKWFQEAL